jgi:hypothetical protein
MAGVLIIAWASNARSAGSVSLDPDQGIGLHVIDGRPVVDGVMVNGHGPYRFLLDTGANVDLIETDLAKAIGLDANYRNNLSSAAGSAAVVGSAGNEIELDSITADRQLFIFSDLEGPHHLSRQIRGLLGQAFLSRFDYMIDLGNKRIIFAKRDFSGVRVQFKMINARPTVETNLGRLVLDSGINSVVLFGVDPTTVTQTVRTLSGSVLAGTVSTKLTIGDTTFWRGDATAVPRQPTESGDGLIPISFFKFVYVCNSESYMVLN